MSLSTPNTSISQLTTNSVTGKSDTFQDLPIITRNIKLNIFELVNSDKQIVNELVYRFCRILTRKRDHSSECRVLIIDTIGSINPIRLGSILRQDSARLRKIYIVRQCKINSTFLTLDAYINRDALMKQPKLIVIYHDEYLVSKTLQLLRGFLPNSKSQIVLVIPKLSRSDRDILNLMPNNQIIKCDFKIDRKEIRPPYSLIEELENEVAQIKSATNQDKAEVKLLKLEPKDDLNHENLNEIYFERFCKNKGVTECVEGHLKEEGLNLVIPGKSSKVGLDTVDSFIVPSKKMKVR